MKKTKQEAIAWAICGCAVWIAFFVVKYTEKPSDFATQCWCHCVQETDGTDYELAMCDAKYDPKEQLTWEQDCAHRNDIY